jgi:hypothetical protein
MTDSDPDLLPEGLEDRLPRESAAAEWRKPARGASGTASMLTQNAAFTRAVGTCFEYQFNRLRRSSRAQA